MNERTPMSENDLLIKITTPYTNKPYWIDSQEPQDLYLKGIDIDIHAADDDFEADKDEVKTIPLAHIEGNCLIGTEDNFDTLDAHSQDYCTLAEELLAMDMLDSYDAVFIIDDIQMSDTCLHTDWLHIVLNSIPNILERTFNFKPELILYLVPTNQQYVNNVNLTEGMSKESVDEWSPFILNDNGFSTNANGTVLYRTC